MLCAVGTKYSMVKVRSDIVHGQNKKPADIVPAGTNRLHIRGTTLITSQADKLLASIKAFADNGASRTLLLPDLLAAAPQRR